ncbi:MAG TPA: patatin-like phospholipase family protein [Stellaceae bacterium]|nr:patatin-like phospholipase family protein [Stellaceae bacterium]
MPRSSRLAPVGAVKRPPFDCVALLLQGGGALGAYQAGVYEALAEAKIHPNWVAGISIGAINSALIAGNPPGERVAKLKAFWEGITASPYGNILHDPLSRIARGTDARMMFNQASATASMFGGASGFFYPRVPSPWLHPRGTVEATSYYDTSHLRATLERLVDFDRINSGETRFSVGAVGVRSGNFVYFDNTTHHIAPAHVMASGSLPPGFPATEVDGEFYWDGGLVSNTPLQWVLQYGPRQDTLAFQVDLWNAEGDFPESIAEVGTRQKEIVYSSRTRENTDRFKNMQRIRHALAALLEKMPTDLRSCAECKFLQSYADHKVYNIVHLIYRSRHYEGDSKDYEFSRLSMEEHWRIGYNDTVRTLRHPKALSRPANSLGVASFDIWHEGEMPGVE